MGMGEGGEQNAPLGRAVIGGLLLRHRGDAVLRAVGIRLFHNLMKKTGASPAAHERYEPAHQ